MPPTRLILDVIQSKWPTEERIRQLRRFARHYDWEPSDIVCEHRDTLAFASSHLVVEYGLQQAAVITFLHEDRPLPTLSRIDREQILRLSYNNAVDWHLFLDVGHTSFLNNRLADQLVRSVPLGVDPNSASAKHFSKYAVTRTRPQLRRVDEALIDVIDYWRRRLAASLGRYNINKQLSALFNLIIFLRVLEDQAIARGERNAGLLQESIQEAAPQTLRKALQVAIRSLGKSAFPQFLREKLDLINVFDPVPRDEAASLLQDFYLNKDAQFPFDFSVISRHALSLVYERYVSLMREPAGGQHHLFGDMATTTPNPTPGTVYTPQFVARFFARYITRYLPAARLPTSTFIDPACGSGVFLRCLAEIFTDASALNDDASQRQIFRNLAGIDSDPSAVDAAQLSLSLLHVARFGDFPKAIDVVCANSLKRLRDPSLKYTAVIANPPFVSWDDMKPNVRADVVAVLGEKARGKADVYQAFLNLAMDRIEPGGLLLFVLPRFFLSGRASADVRRRLETEFSVEILADLSNIDVFDGTSVYVVLLVARKTPPARQVTTVVRCRDFPGQALHEALHGRTQETEYYQVFQMPQLALQGANWQLLPHREMQLLAHLKKHERLGEVADLRTGMVTGGRKLFFAESGLVPDDEVALWPQVLLDREMRQFFVPAKTAFRVFFPTVAGEPLQESDVRKYSWTWQLLSSKKARLKERAAVKNDGVPWWRPHRLPAFILSPKIVAPHLAAAPRFSYDAKGQFVVTQGPVIKVKAPATRDNIEWYLLAVLNSAPVKWQIQRSADRYARGYALLEPKTLKEVRIPKPADVPVRVYAELVKRAKQMANEETASTDDLAELDSLVLEAFGIPADISEMVQLAF